MTAPTSLLPCHPNFQPVLSIDNTQLEARREKEPRRSLHEQPLRLPGWDSIRKRRRRRRASQRCPWGSGLAFGSRLLRLLRSHHSSTLNLFLVALWNACVLPNQPKFYYKNKINLTWVEIEKRTSHLKT